MRKRMTRLLSTLKRILHEATFPFLSKITVGWSTNVGDAFVSKGERLDRLFMRNVPGIS